MRSQIFANLYALFAAAWRRRYLVFVPCLVMPVLATLAGMATPKMYESHTTVLIQETSKLNPFLADFAVATQLKERMAAMKALLHSRHILLKVAEDLALIDNPESPQTDRVIQSLSNALHVELIGSDLIKLTYTGPTPDRIKETLTVVSQLFLGTLLAPERSSIEASETFLEAQLRRQHEDLINAETILATFKSENSAGLPDQYNFDIKQLRSAEETLRERQTALVGAKALLNSLNTQLLKTNPMISSIEKTIADQTSRLTILRARYTDGHSEVVALSRNLKRLETERENIIASTSQLTTADIEKLWRIATTLSTDETSTNRPLLVSQLEAIESAKSRETQLEEEIAQLGDSISKLKTKLESFGSLEQQLTELQRNTSTKKMLYEDILKRYELAKVTGALGTFESNDRAKIIDPPFTPGTPINLPVIAFTLAGIFGGLFLGIGLATVAEIADTTLWRRESVERILEVPVITRLPLFSPDNLNTDQLTLAKPERTC